MSRLIGEDLISNLEVIDFDIDLICTYIGIEIWIRKLSGNQYRVELAPQTLEIAIQQNRELLNLLANKKHKLFKQRTDVFNVRFVAESNI